MSERINLEELRRWAEREAAHPESATYPTTVIALVEAVEATEAMLSTVCHSLACEAVSKCVCGLTRVEVAHDRFDFGGSA